MWVREKADRPWHRLKTPGAAIETLCGQERPMQGFFAMAPDGNECCRHCLRRYRARYGEDFLAGFVD